MHPYTCLTGNLKCDTYVLSLSVEKHTTYYCVVDVPMYMYSIISALPSSLYAQYHFCLPPPPPVTISGDRMSEGSAAVTASENGDVPKKRDVNESTQFGMNRSSSVDIFRTCADPGMYVYTHSGTINRGKLSVSQMPCF